MGVTYVEWVDVWWFVKVLQQIDSVNLKIQLDRLTSRIICMTP